MKRVTLYLIIIVAVSAVVTGFWVYERYVKSDTTNQITFTVTRGDLTELVRARGEVVSQKEYNMEFPNAGTVEQVYVTEGEEVNRGDPLMKLDTRDLEIELTRLTAVRAQNEASLQKLEAGETPEDLSVSESKVTGDRAAVEDAEKALMDSLNDAYARADDAIRNKVDPIFINPRTNTQLAFTTTDAQAEIDLESLRSRLESQFAAWQASLAAMSTSSDLSAYEAAAQVNLSLARTVCDKATLALNNVVAGGNLTQTTIDTWRANISAGRTSLGTAITNLTAAREALRTAQATLDYDERALVSKQAGSRAEDIASARAKVEETANQIAAVEDKIAKATLRAPAAARVMKVYLERKEVSNAGTTALTLSISDQKVQADISELDIGKIREDDGNPVTIEFDAFPDEFYVGRVASVEPQVVVKDGDKYFRLNVFFDRATSSEHIIRTGMSADLVITTAEKQGVLKIPELAVYKRGKQRFVKVLENGVPTEVEVETGISDGESVEIVEGLTEGQTVVVTES
jgi:multidrug efflux pump subunit AcrA (membrane-fusion protein)